MKRLIRFYLMSEYLDKNRIRVEDYTKGLGSIEVTYSYKEGFIFSKRIRHTVTIDIWDILVFLFENPAEF